MRPKSKKKEKSKKKKEKSKKGKGEFSWCEDPEGHSNTKLHLSKPFVF
jgi:hypothetical protein